MNNRVFNRSDQALNKLIAARFSASLMSNAKWVKLITKLVELSPSIDSCSVKLIWDDTNRELFIDENTTYQFDYYPEAMEAMISGEPLGWYRYKEIEWIEIIPLKNSAAKPVRNDPLYGQILQVGIFEFENWEGKLKIYSYQYNSQRINSSASLNSRMIIYP
jgi:hypothetical protein